MSERRKTKCVLVWERINNNNKRATNTPKKDDQKSATRAFASSLAFLCLCLVCACLIHFLDAGPHPWGVGLIVLIFHHFWFDTDVDKGRSQPSNMDVLLHAIKEDDGGGKKKGARTGAAAAAAAGAGVEVRACGCLTADWGRLWYGAMRRTHLWAGWTGRQTWF